MPISEKNTVHDQIYLCFGLLPPWHFNLIAEYFQISMKICQVLVFSVLMYANLHMCYQIVLSKLPLSTNFFKCPLGFSSRLSIQYGTYISALSCFNRNHKCGTCERIQLTVYRNTAGYRKQDAMLYHVRGCFSICKNVCYITRKTVVFQQRKKPAFTILRYLQTRYKLTPLSGQ